MWLEILFRYLHFVAVFLVVASITAEALLLRAQLTRAQIRQLARIDAIYGIAAILLLGAGMVLWWAVGKPAAFYSRNWIFLLKMLLFALVGGLSAYPTVFFLKQRRGEAAQLVTVPRAVRWCVYAECVCLLIIPLLASLMAKGIGYIS